MCLLCVTLKPTVLRRGYGGGTCLRQVVICQKISKLTHLDHVFGTSFCSFALNLKRSVIKKWSKSIEADPVLEHLFVVSHLTWRDPWSKSEQKVMKWTLFGTSFCSFALNLKRSVIKKWSKTALEHTFCSFAANLKRSVQKVFPSQHRFLDPSYTIAPKGATLPCRCILVGLLWITQYNSNVDDNWPAT